MIGFSVVYAVGIDVVILQKTGVHGHFLAHF